MGFLSTAYAPFCVSVGITLPEIALINAGFFLAIVLSELPTGLLADGRGRVWSIRLGSGISAAGFVLYSCIWEFWGAMLSEILIGIGFAFLSGSLQAWLTDALIERGESDRLQYTFGRGAMWFALASVAGGLVGGHVGAQSLRLAMFVTAFFFVLKLVMACLLMREEGKADRAGEISALRQSFGALKAGRGLVWAMMAAASYGLVLSFNHYWALFFRGQVGQANLGYVWAVMMAAVAFGGWLVQRVSVGKGKEHLAVVAALVITGIGMFLCGYVPGLWLASACAFAHEVGRGAFVPLLDTYVQRRIEKSYRATYGSLQSLVSRLCFVVIISTIWAVTSGIETDGTFIPLVWGVQGVALVAVSLLLALLRLRSR